jgi:hypothetical protein
MGGQPKSEASSLSSPDVRALWAEPTEAIPKNQRDQAVGGCQLHEREDAEETVLRAPGNGADVMTKKVSWFSARSQSPTAALPLFANWSWGCIPS